MLSLSVVEHFDILEDTRTDLVSGLKVLELYVLGFDSVEEAFRDSIVVTTEGKTLFQAVSLDECPKVLSGVLTSAIRVQDQSGVNVSSS